MENNLNLHKKRPHEGPHEVHGLGLIETDEALGGVFVRLAVRGKCPTCPRNEEIVQCDPGGLAQGFVDLDLGSYSPSRIMEHPKSKK